MTDRINSVIVVLEQDIRDDDAKSILDAILMVKGVLTVDPQVADIASHVAHRRVTNEILEKVIDLLTTET